MPNRYFTFMSSLHGTASRLTGNYLWTSQQAITGDELLITTPSHRFYHESIEQWILAIPGHNTVFKSITINEPSGLLLSSRHRKATCGTVVDLAQMDRIEQPVFTIHSHVNSGLFIHPSYRASALNRFGPHAIDDEPFLVV